MTDPAAGDTRESPAPPVVTRLYKCLLDALRHARPDTEPEQPVTVAEIYQTLVPYRRVRARLGVELNADYEHALMRLLAGEGGYVRLEPEQAREELRRELESPNPNVGIFRKFAACDARVEPDGGEGESRGGESTEGHASPPSSGTDARSTREEGRRTPSAGTPEQPSPPDAPAHPAAEIDHEDDGAPSCTFCGTALPAGRRARYCPFCGADQQRRPCPGCGEALEAEWRYCIACGHESAPSGT